MLIVFLKMFHQPTVMGGENDKKKTRKKEKRKKDRKKAKGGGRDGLSGACQIQSITGKQGLWELIPNEMKSFAYAEANATRAYIYSQDSTLIIQSTYFLTTQHIQYY